MYYILFEWSKSWIVGQLLNYVYRNDEISQLSPILDDQHIGHKRKFGSISHSFRAFLLIYISLYRYLKASHT